MDKLLLSTASVPGNNLTVQAVKVVAKWFIIGVKRKTKTTLERYIQLGKCLTYCKSSIVVQLYVNIAVQQAWNSVLQKKKFMYNFKELLYGHLNPSDFYSKMSNLRDDNTYLVIEE